MNGEKFTPEDLAEIENPGGREREIALQQLRAQNPSLDTALSQLEGELDDQSFLDAIGVYNQESAQQDYTGSYTEHYMNLSDGKRKLSVRKFANGTIELRGSVE